jgi:hypothetical protein
VGRGEREGEVRQGERGGGQMRAGEGVRERDPLPSPWEVSLWEVSPSVPPSLWRSLDRSEGEGPPRAGGRVGTHWDGMWPYPPPFSPRGLSGGTAGGRLWGDGGGERDSERGGRGGTRKGNSSEPGTAVERPILACSFSRALASTHGGRTLPPSGLRSPLGCTMSALVPSHGRGRERAAAARPRRNGTTPMTTMRAHGRYVRPAATAADAAAAAAAAADE